MKHEPGPTDAEAALASVGGGARRRVAWEELDPGFLSPSGRREVGLSWRGRMVQEHLAVGAFALLAQELAETGCDPIVLSLVTRAAADEVRHAEICRRYAVAFLGEAEVPRQVRGLPRVPKHQGAAAADRTLLHVVEMCCLSETLTGVYFTEMLARATVPAAREAIESLLEDEIDHGRVGWAYLGACVRSGQAGALAKELPAMLARTVGAVLDARPRGVDEESAALERCGYLGELAGREVYERALFEVILPGFEELGVDVGAAREAIRERGWRREG